jgi:hypothetical protein
MRRSTAVELSPALQHRTSTASLANIHHPTPTTSAGLEVSEEGASPSSDARETFERGAATRVIERIGVPTLRIHPVIPDSLSMMA